MTQTQRRLYLIRQLQKEQPEYMDIKIPLDEQGQKNLLRALFNLRCLRMPDRNSSTYRMPIFRKKYGAGESPILQI